MNSFSPICTMPRLARHLGIDLRAKRDDLLAAPGGGNKIRKACKVFQKAKELGCNAVVTTGGIQSNHARVVAIIAAQLGWRCKLILHGDLKSLDAPAGNLLLMRLCGAEILIVDPSAISIGMQRCMDELRNDGFSPFEIPGGGHCLEGALAYVDAVHELRDQCGADNWKPDFIILASGTGATQAGIIVGLESIGWKTGVIGISVARKNPRGTDVIARSCSELRRYLQLEPAGNAPIRFFDNWVGNGYEKAGPKIFDAIRLSAQLEGLILDPTYTGKAFAAMIDLRSSGEIKTNSKVLFWHTGGLLNLMASNYIGDIIEL